MLTGVIVAGVSWATCAGVPPEYASAAITGTTITFKKFPTLAVMSVSQAGSDLALAGDRRSRFGLRCYEARVPGMVTPDPDSASSIAFPDRARAKTESHDRGR